MSGNLFEQDPQAKKPYRWPWAGVIGATDPITTYTFTEETGDLTLSGFSVSGTDTICWIAGGTDGKIYHVNGHIETVNGLIDERTLTLHVVQQ